MLDSFKVVAQRKYLSRTLISKNITTNIIRLQDRWSWIWRCRIYCEPPSSRTTSTATEHDYLPTMTWFAISKIRMYMLCLIFKVKYVISSSSNQKPILICTYTVVRKYSNYTLITHGNNVKWVNTIPNWVHMKLFGYIMFRLQCMCPYNQLTIVNYIFRKMLISSNAFSFSQVINM